MKANATKTKRPALPDIGRYPVWMRGSHETIRRTVYISDDRYWIVWYGSLIEVRRSNSGFGFRSIEEY